MSNILDSLPGIVLPSLMFYFFFVRPARRVREAKSWRETPCVIVFSAVKEDETDSGLYTILMTYQYAFAGRTYTSSRYSFSVLATAGSILKKRVTRRLAPGTTATCYVNPNDPQDAVIDRRLTWDMVSSAVFALIFFGVFLFFFWNGSLESDGIR
jgi:uncharacterized protein DUF3592